MNFKKLLAQSIFWRGFYFFSILLVNIFLSRYLQAAGSGSLYFLTIIFSFSQAVLALGLEQGITYFASGSMIPRNRLIIIDAVWSIVAGLLMIAIVRVYLYFDDTIQSSLDTNWPLYGFLYIAGQSLMNYTTALYYTKENYLLPNFLISIVNIVYVFLIPSKDAVTTAKETEQVITLYFFTFFISGLVLLCSFLLYNRKEGTYGLPSKTSFKNFLRYSLTALGANVIFFLVYRIDYLFVNESPAATAEDMGNYIQVAKLGQLLLVVPQIIASVVFPRTASGIDRERLNAVIMVISRLFSQLFLLLFTGVLIFGKAFFIKLFGETFNAMQAPMLILIPGIFCLSVLVLLSAYFSGKGKVKVNVQGAVMALVVMVAGAWMFVPRYGIVAAAAVSTVSYAVNMAYSLFVFYKDYRVNFIDFFRWRKDDYSWIKNLLVKEK
ncbi:polysaccharide biosynthesis C-terminal domain-containing protein [Panacibacter sp. DH6]|uniref:Polysaccharide biosynthesis C-terminal domain-containing protein n=1 Tax=Panacibacter microcysteis TaxID=2793269 RepID=A0A931H0H6_9BACT|nr:polysaccharide biosynthesis C-terminal domain-containing protein [Panacibacter microcysteis]MBG9378648.1 polysaccharide biosynthesis C-terminal domain-containing protein [Panacibacter microcysteis]